MGANKSDADGFPLKQLFSLSALPLQGLLLHLQPTRPEHDQLTFHVVSISTSLGIGEWWQFGAFGFQVQYSAEPHLYGNATHEHPSTQDQGNHLAEVFIFRWKGLPSIKKIIHVLEKVQYLEQEVEEFMGKDRQSLLASGRDANQGTPGTGSVETEGQDSVRQARKGAV